MRLCVYGARGGGGAVKQLMTDIGYCYRTYLSLVVCRALAWAGLEEIEGGGGGRCTGRMSPVSNR